MAHPLYLVEKHKGSSTPITLVGEKQYDSWLKKQDKHTRHWLEATEFNGKAGRYALMPGADGTIDKVVCGIDDMPDIWSIAHLATQLPAQYYTIENRLDVAQATQFSLGWSLATYQFSRYKKSKKKCATLVVSPACNMVYVRSMAHAIFWARDLINTPANDMNPDALAEEAVAWAQDNGGKAQVISGDTLLKENYPMIHAVGRASSIPPHLVELNFGYKGLPRITLVGKGVCFDTGGLDIKSTAGMKLMKKDMGGAANVLALAKVIVDMKLPVQLRVLLPIVENAISGNAMRPQDIVATRKGITVEIGNTDAEGRLILCDALTAACEDAPSLIIDCATLTGAARVALGTDIPAFFTHDKKIAAALSNHSESEMDLLWRLPLWKGYRNMLDAANADLSNDPESGYGGAITAALYLNEFVDNRIPWIHIDMMAWNVTSRPGRPKGGEAMGVRALYAYLEERYGNQNKKS